MKSIATDTIFIAESIKKLPLFFFFFLIRRKIKKKKINTAWVWRYLALPFLNLLHSGMQKASCLFEIVTRTHFNRILYAGNHLVGLEIACK